MSDRYDTWLADEPLPADDYAAPERRPSGRPGVRHAFRPEIEDYLNRKHGRWNPATRSYDPAKEPDMVFDPTAIDDYDADAERDRKRDAEDDPGPPAIGSVEELDAAVRGTAAELEAAIDAKVAAADDDELFAPADDLPLVSAGQALVMEAYEGFRDPLVEPIDEREADRSVEAYLQVEAFRARLKARFEAEDAKAARVLDVLATRYGPAWRAYVLEHRRGRAKNVDTATGRIQLRKPPAKTLEVTDEDAVAEWAERCYVDGVVRWSRRVLKTALREWIDAHPGEPLPDGVDFDRGDAPDKVSIVPPKETGKK